MARPLKDGLDFFSLDVNFFQDKKIQLIKSEFGVKGIGVLIALLCDIYGRNGYFKYWDNDDCLLTAEALAGGCNPEYISQVVHGCLRRSLFDNTVFKVSGVLTSAGIQRRFIRAMTKREEIPVIKEYWLLDLDEKKDVPASVRDKVVLKSVSAPGNPFKTVHNPVKTVRNPQSKVKESKGLKDLKELKDLNDDDDVNDARAQAQPGCGKVESRGKVESHVENLKAKAMENLETMESLKAKAMENLKSWKT